MTEYLDEVDESQLMTPRQAKKQIETLGYADWTQVPFGVSDYFDTLITIATSKKPLNFVDVRDTVRAAMNGRSSKYSG